MASVSRVRQRVRMKPSTLPALPDEVGSKISSYFPPIEVHNPRELELLLRVYPFDYVAVEVKDIWLFGSSVRTDCYSRVVEQFEAKLKEVVIDVFYDKWHDFVDKLLKMNLECLTLGVYVDNTTRHGLAHFVQACCQSNNKRHFIELEYFCSPSDVATNADVARLLREDAVLLDLVLKNALVPIAKSSFFSELQGPNSSSLRHLRLENCVLGSPEATLLSNAVASNSSLVTLYVRSASFTDTQITVLGEGLACNKGLLSFTGLFFGGGEAGAEAFARAMARNNKIESLSFEGASLQTGGATAFADLLRTNRSLRLLSLNYCRIGLDGCRLIVDAIEDNTTLEELHLVLCGIASTDKARLLEMPRDWAYVETGCGNDVKSPELSRRMLWRPQRSRLGIIYREHSWWRAEDIVQHEILEKL